MNREFTITAPKTCVRETIKIPMMSGDNAPCDVLTFYCDGQQFCVRRISERLCYILHRPTGLKVTDELTGDPKEAAQGFVDAVRVGVYDLSKVAEAASKSPVINH